MTPAENQGIAKLQQTVGTPCRSCGDTRKPDTTCSRCGGHGLVHGYEGDPIDCPSCWGAGVVWPPYCDGCGKFRSMKGWT